MEKQELTPRPHPQGKHVLPPHHHNSFVITCGITTYMWTNPCMIRTLLDPINQLVGPRKKTDAVVIGSLGIARRDPAAAICPTIARRDLLPRLLVDRKVWSRSIGLSSWLAAASISCRTKPHADSSLSRTAAASAFWRAAQHTATSSTWLHDLVYFSY